MNSLRMRVATALVAGLGACALPSVATTAEAGGPGVVSAGEGGPDAVEAVEATAGPAQVALDLDGGPVAVAGGKAEVSVVSDPDRGLGISADGGPSIAIGLIHAGKHCK